MICYHLYDLKNVKKPRKSVSKVGCFSRILNCTNGIKSRKTSQIFYCRTLILGHQHCIRNDESIELSNKNFLRLLHISPKCFENIAKFLFTPNMLCPTCKLPEFSKNSNKQYFTPNMLYPTCKLLEC